ncbi:hypothetical protein Fcan01_21763 [Folsomia candida]|uniref:Uncharacterized protein n=1 Tax=Folsomia candida TaxID=158441 RepID=A0A226DEG1_FOLCA|nr:hypothetical protein Fcan01_21763 [Folsomia candida]
MSQQVVDDATPNPHQFAPQPLLNPCSCCCTLQEGVKAIAIFEIVSWSILIMTLGLMMPFVGAFVRADDPKVLEVVMLSFGLCMAIFIVFLALGIVLLWGARRRNAKACLAWLVGHSILDVVRFVFSLVLNIEGGDNVGFSYFNYTSIVISLYFYFVVYCFIREIKANLDGGAVEVLGEGQSTRSSYISTGISSTVAGGVLSPATDAGGVLLGAIFEV